MSNTVESHSALVVEALDRLDTVVLVLDPPRPPATSPHILAANATFVRRVITVKTTTALGDLSRFILPQSSAASLSALCRATIDGTKLSGEIQLAGHAGPFWLGFSLATVSAPGMAPRCVLIGKDITDQLRRSGEDRATHRLLASAFMAVGTPVAIVTGGDRIVTASLRFAQLCGRSPKETGGNSIAGVLDADVRQRIQTALTASPPGAPAVEFRGGGTRHDATAFQASFSLSVIEGRGSERLAVVTINPDADDTDTAGTPEGGTDAVSKICLLGLAEVKTALGAKWPAVADRAMILAETAIRRRLGPKDVLSRTTDQAFLIWFHDGSADDNAVAAARIAREVRIVLLTEFADTLMSSVASATVQLPQGATPGQLTAESLSALDQHPALQPNPELEAARAYLAWVEKELPVDVEQMYGRGGQPLPAVWCSLPDSVVVRLENEAALLADETFGGFELEILRLRAGLSVAEKAAARNVPRSCFVPISLACLASHRSRRAVMEVVGAIDAATATRLTLLLAGDFGGWKPARMQELVAPFKGRVRSVGLAAKTVATVPMALLSRPFSAVSFESEVLGSERAELAMWQAMDAIHRTGCKVIARRVGTPSEARKLLELGVDFVCGTAPASGLEGG